MGQNQSQKEIEKRFKASVDKPNNFLQSDYIVGFEYLNVPVILNTSPDIITTNYHWGLVPSWSNDIDFRKNTLNARIETIQEKPSFKNVVQNRCLIIATSFYEWRWLDEKGKKKEKYQINSQDDEIFCFAGLYDSWLSPLTGEVLNSFTMVTTQANDIMQYIHNHKKRMPVVINKEDELNYLDKSNSIEQFAYPYESKIIGLQTNLKY